MMTPHTDKILQSLTQHCHRGGGDVEGGEEVWDSCHVSCVEFREVTDNTVPSSETCLVSRESFVKVSYKVAENRAFQ